MATSGVLVGKGILTTYMFDTGLQITPSMTRQITSPQYISTNMDTLPKISAATFEIKSRPGSSHWASMVEHANRYKSPKAIQSQSLEACEKQTISEIREILNVQQNGTNALKCGVGASWIASEDEYSLGRESKLSFTHNTQIATNLGLNSAYLNANTDTAREENGFMQRMNSLLSEELNTACDVYSTRFKRSKSQKSAKQKKKKKSAKTDKKNKHVTNELNKTNHHDLMIKNSVQPSEPQRILKTTSVIFPLKSQNQKSPFMIIKGASTTTNESKSRPNKNRPESPCKQNYLRNSRENILASRSLPSPVFMKPTKVYCSERQTVALAQEGLMLPGAPPATPTPDMLKKYEYIPSMADVKAQRALKLKLQAIEKTEKKKQEKCKKEAAKLQEQQLKELERQKRHRQRQEIYALNQVMTKLENDRFVAFCKQHGLCGYKNAP